MKKILIFSVLVFVMTLYAWFEVYLKNPKNKNKILLLSKEGTLIAFHLTTAHVQMKMKFENGLWQIVQPHSYPADQEFVEESFSIMDRTPILSTFFLEEDRFGFNPGKAFMEFIYENGLRRRLIIGKEQGLENTLYVLDKDSNQVSVVHSVFGQFLHYPPTMFFHKSLPIPGKKIQSLKLIQWKGTRTKELSSPSIQGVKQKHIKKRNGKSSGHPESHTLWQVARTDQNHARVNIKGQDYQVDKRKLHFFFQKLRSFEVKNHRFEKPGNFERTSSLFVKTEEGMVRFDFNDKAGQIYSKTQGVLGEFQPSILTSLDDNLKEVIDNDKR